MIELLEHNKSTYRKLCDVLSENSKCALIQATGTGKSYIVGKYLEEYGNRILVLVPSNSIGDAWEDLLSHIDKKIDIVTYQMFSSKCEKYSDYDIVVADEMHHLGSEVWGKKFVETYSEKSEIKIIGLTATEIRYLDNSRDMSEEIFDSIRVDGCDLKTAIQDGILPKFKYVSALYCDEDDYDEFRKKADKITDEELRKQLKGRLEICIENMVSIQQAITENLTHDYKKIIIFLNGVKTKEEAMDVFKEVFPDANFYDVDSYKDRKLNRITLDMFRKDDKRAVLFAVDMLNEGIHVKGTDCVIMLRKTISPQVYFQQLGRCLSSSATKMPIVFDFVNNAKNIKVSFDVLNRVFDLGTERVMRQSEYVCEEIIFKNYQNDIYSVIEEIYEKILFKKYTQEEILFIKNSYGKMKEKEIASCLNRTIKSVQTIISDLGLRNGRHVLTKDLYDFMVLQGKTEEEIFAELGYTNKESFNKRLKQIGVKTSKRQRKKHNWLKEHDEILTKYYEFYGSQKVIEIMEKDGFFLSESQVKRRAKLLGILSSKSINGMNVICENENEKIFFPSIPKCANYLGVNHKTVRAIVDSDKKIKGFQIKRV